MRRQLFLLHVRRSVTNVVIVFVAVLAVIYIVERITLARAGEGAAQVPEIVNMVLIGGLMLAAFPVGSAAFGKSFREQQALFLYSLPVRRIETWAILVGAAATSYLLLLATAAVVRPSLIGTIGTAFEDAAARDIGNGAAMVAVLFAGGACLALVAPRQAVAVASGLLLIGPSIGFLTLINADRFRPAAADEAILGGLSVLVGVPLLAAIFLVLSALFYVRGEHELLSQVVLRYAAVIGAILLAGVLFFAATALADRRAPMRASHWDAILSPRGQYLALIEANRSLRQRQLRVFDAETGRELSRRRSPLLDAVWSADDRLLVIDSNASVTRLILPLRLETTATFYRPDGTIVSRQELPGATEANVTARWRLDERPENEPLLALESWRGHRSTFHVYAVDGSALQAMGRGDGSIRSTPLFVDGKRVLGSYDRGVQRFFRATRPLEELRWSARPSPGTSTRNFFLLDALLHPTEASAMSALSASYPIDGALREAIRHGGESGYLSARQTYSLVALNPVRYFVAGQTHGSIWEWREKGWVLLTNSVEMPKRRGSTRPVFFSLPPSAAKAPDGTILLTRHEGETTEVLVASAEGEKSLGRVSLPNAEIWAGWARREPPTLVAVVVSNPTRTVDLIADLARNAILATSSRKWMVPLDVRADGTRIGIFERVEDDSSDEARREGPVEIVPRRRSFSLVEVRPDGTRHETPLGE